MMAAVFTLWSSNAAIPILVLCHVVVGIVASICSADQIAISSAIFLGIIFCQVSLLGMWFGLGASPWMLRLIGLIAGSVYLAIECGLGINELDFEIILLVTLPIALVSVMTWIVRRCRGTLQRVEADHPEVHEALQFTIGHLMLLTFVVACLLTAGKYAAPWLPGLGMLSQIALLGVCYAAVALTAIWAMLGDRHLVVRGAVVMVMASLAGFLADYILDEDPSGIIFWPATTLLQASLLIASLLVCRIAGYRFVAKASRAT